MKKFLLVAYIFLSFFSNNQAQTSFEVIAIFPAANDAQLQANFRSWGGTLLDESPLSKARLWRFPSIGSFTFQGVIYSYSNSSEGVDRVRAGTTVSVGSEIPIEIVLNRPMQSPEQTANIGGAPLPSPPPFSFLPTTCASLESSLKVPFGQKRSVTVAFLDTGIPCEKKGSEVRQTEPSLRTSNLRAPYNFINRTDVPNDDNGHGTATASIVWNQFAREGCAKQLTLMPIKVLDSRGMGTLFNLIKGIDYATERQADIINISIISPDPTVYAKPTPIQYVMDLAKSKNILIVAAAGNGNGTVGIDIGIRANYCYPACARNTNLLVVGATVCNSGIARFSNYAKKNVDIFAPGQGIRVLWKPVIESGFATARFAQVDGTSYATPIVTGIAALLATHQSANNADALKNAVFAGSDYKAFLSGKSVKESIVNGQNALTNLGR